MWKKIKNEKGMLIVEATIVFPVTFLVIFLLLVLGNAYFQKCRVEYFADSIAVQGASYCSDTILKEVEQGNIPELDQMDIKPYRYFLGGMSDVVSEMNSSTDTKVRKLSTGLFSGMKPANPVIDVKFNNMYIYSTFSVDIKYDVVMPVRLLFQKDNFRIGFHTRADVPVSDTVEFMRNVDMADDYLEKTGLKDKITEVINKAKEWFNR